MPARCKACSHPRRAELNDDILKGRLSDGAVATKYGISRSSIQRHRLQHLTFSNVEATESRNILTIIGYAADLYERAGKLLTLAEAIVASEPTTKGVSAAAGALREVRACVELLSRLITTQEGDEVPARNAELDDLIMQQITMIQTPLALPPGIEDAEVIPQ